MSKRTTLKETLEKASETRIKSVSFRSCVTIAQFRTVHIEASADVPVGVDPTKVVEDLKNFVASELKIAKDGEVRPVRRRFRDYETADGSFQD